MKKSILLLSVCALYLFACNNSSDNGEEEVVYETVTDTASAAGSADSLLTIVNRPSLWTVEMPENNREEKLKQPQDEKIKSLSAAQLVSAINDNFSDVQLHFDKISHDTLYVDIPESERLTQQLGSTGAYNYMAMVVYNLTELNQVKFVHFDFKEGDHATPGTFSREDYKHLR